MFLSEKFGGSVVRPRTSSKHTQSNLGDQSPYIWILTFLLSFSKEFPGLERVCSQTQLCQLRRLMAILDNYMFRPLLAIFMLSLRELKFLLYSRALSSVKRQPEDGQ